MWVRIFDKFLRHLIRDGDLTVTFADGHVRRYGNGTGPAVAITLHDAHLPRRIVLSPDMAVGEGYMDGRLTIEDDDVHGFLSLAIRNISAQGQPWYRRPLEGLRRLKRRLDQFNPVARARANVAHHYDLDEQLFRAFLDDDMQYSCAYWPPGVTDLDTAQAAKRALIRKKLCLKPGQRVLDIGCGWGGLAIELAKQAGAKVVGLTLSEQQARVARERVRERGLTEQVDIRLQDYRDVSERFDRIVSVGMFEHVGVRYYRRFFRELQKHLTPDGLALIHTIGRSGPPTVTNPWIRRYIFPGGYIPAMSEVTAAIERQGLVITDVEVLRLHYAETLAHWFSRFQQSRQTMVEAKGERFCRLWEFYLAACEGAFRWGDLVVFHFQISQQKDAAPLTRDYLC